jgi:hypothetical protein
VITALRRPWTYDLQVEEAVSTPASPAPAVSEGMCTLGFLCLCVASHPPA